MSGDVQNFPTNSPLIILVAVNATRWPAFFILYHSLIRHGLFEICVLDIGLSQDQRACLRDYGVQIRLAVPAHPAAYLLEYGERPVLWLAPTTVALRPLDGLVAAIERGPVITLASRGQPALNQALIGCKPGRDRAQLEAWLRGIEPPALADQPWLRPARRNLYERTLDRLGTPEYRWPLPDLERMGGDLFDNLRLDNPDAILLDFDGPPTLDKLCVVDHPITVACRERICATTSRVFIVGLERCGTHSVAEILRRSCTGWSWVRHEINPRLAKEAYLRHEGQDYRTDEFEQKLAAYGRRDAALVVEANHRLAYFVDELAERYPTAKFVLLWRDAHRLLTSRLLNYAHWSDLFPQLPHGYQQAASEYWWRANQEITRCPEAREMNDWRIRPPMTEPDHMARHSWEIVHTAALVLRQFKQLPSTRTLVLRVENLLENLEALYAFIGCPLLRLPLGQLAAQQHYGQKLWEPPLSVRTWIEQQIARVATTTQQQLDELFEIG